MLRRIICKFLGHRPEAMYSFDLDENDEPGEEYIDDWYCMRCVTVLRG